MLTRSIDLHWQRRIEQANGTLLTSQSSGYTDFLNHSSIVKGDRKNPNPWSYVTNTSIRYRTKEGGFHKWFSGYDTLQHKYTGSFGSQSDIIPVPPWDRALMYNQALERLNDKVRGGLDLSISAFEVGQTKKMITSLAKVIIHAKRTVSRSLRRAIAHRHNPRLPPDPSLDVANGYLQFTYGWRPLLSDVFAIAEESRRKLFHELETFRGRSSKPVDGLGLVTRQVNSYNYAPVLADGLGKASCTITIGLMPPSGSFDLARWTSLNPISIGWELIPYSFVVDWFYDVGSHLRNLETGLLYGASFKNGYVSELFLYDGVESVKDGKYRHPTNGDGHEFRGVEGDIHHRTFYRSILPSYPFPRPPTIKVELSAARLLSAASLLRQILSRL